MAATDWRGEGPVRLKKPFRQMPKGHIFEPLGSLRAWLFENGYVDYAGQVPPKAPPARARR